VKVSDSLVVVSSAVSVTACVIAMTASVLDCMTDFAVKDVSVLLSVAAAACLSVLLTFSPPQPAAQSARLMLSTAAIIFLIVFSSYFFLFNYIFADTIGFHSLFFKKCNYSFLCGEDSFALAIFKIV
jgi:hypothetical protein